MKSRFRIYLIFAVLIGAYYFYDRANRTEEILAATVVSVEARDPGDGPDQWHVTARIGDDEVALPPVTARPDLAVGDPFCVLRITRAGQPADILRASAGETC